MVSAHKKPLCKVRAYASPANFMPQLMRVSYIRRVRARLSCGVWRSLPVRPSLTQRLASRISYSKPLMSTGHRRPQSRTERRICDMQFADVPWASKTQTAILWIQYTMVFPCGKGSETKMPPESLLRLSGDRAYTPAAFKARRGSFCHSAAKYLHFLGRTQKMRKPLDLARFPH